MLSQQTIDFLTERHKNKISLAELLDLYKLKYPNASYIRVARKLFDDLKIKYEPEGVYKDDVWIENPRYNKDYGFNSYFIVEYDQSFLLDYFTVDNGRMVADALNYVINNISYELVSNLEENLNCSARDFLGAYTDVFLDAFQLSEKFNISVLKEYKELEEQIVQNKKLSKISADSTKLQEEKAQNAQRQSAVDSDDFSIYGHKSELLEILFKVTAEFWADSETPPKNSVIEQWIETNYPVKDYPYVSKAVRQYIATILRPQPKLK